MQITPSILTSDLARLAEEIDKVANADGLHIDVMDNHFVPNLTVGRPVVAAVRQVTDLPIDVHLMIENPDRWAPDYADAGAQTVTFHAEAAVAPIRLARKLRSLGVAAGLALRPATPIEPYADFLDEFDRVLIMTVEPGFGGQTFIEAMLAKVTRTRQYADRLGVSLNIQLDGGISLDTIGRCAQAGADVFVAGAAVYSSDDPAGMVAALRQAAEASV